MYNKILLLFVAIIVLSGCRHKKQQEATDTLVSGVITIVADENLQNILEAELDVFSVRFPEAFIFPQYLDERQAINYLVKDSVKLAIMRRNLDRYERSLLPKTRVVNCYPFGYEGIAFLVSRTSATRSRRPRCAVMAHSRSTPAIRPAPRALGARAVRTPQAMATNRPVASSKSSRRTTP